MNFFAHSVVASWRDPSAAHVLGSMVPDFETMIGQRLLNPGDSSVERGIDFHHRSDEVFHRSPSFVGLCSHAVSALTERGVRRGTARAVAHVGAELLLDGLLARDPAHAHAYHAALEAPHASALQWPDQGAAFLTLRRRLRRWGPPTDYENPGFVLQRLERTLAARPRLRILDEQRAAIHAFVPVLRRQVEHCATELLGQVRSGLALWG